MRLSATLSERLRDGASVAVLTGAGVSAESGLETFRSPGGLWRSLDPTTLATPGAFREDPRLVWQFYDDRRERAASVEPNLAHLALAAMDRTMPSFFLATQNVDGLHERAGSRRLVRLHGSLWTLRCVAEGTEQEDRRPRIPDLPPRCSCGALLRPGVVWFGEPLDPALYAKAEAAARSAGVFLVVGTSAIVHPAAALPEIAADAGAWVVEVNPAPTPISAWVHERLEATATTAMPLLAAAAGAVVTRAP